MLLQSQPWAIVATMDLNRSLWRNSKEQLLFSICDVFVRFLSSFLFNHVLLIWNFFVEVWRINTGVSNTMTMAFVSSNAGGRQGTTLVEHTLEEVSREEGSQIVGCVDG